MLAGPSWQLPQSAARLCFRPETYLMKAALMSCNNRPAKDKRRWPAGGFWLPLIKLSLQQHHPRVLHLFLSSDVRHMCTYFKFNYYTLPATNSGRKQWRQIQAGAIHPSKWGRRNPFMGKYAINSHSQIVGWPFKICASRKYIKTSISSKGWILF